MSGCLSMHECMITADWLSASTQSHPLVVSGLLLLGCVNAVAYNLVHSLVINITSAVTTTVIGEMKIVLILVLSAVLLGVRGG